MKFTEMNLIQPIQKALKRINYVDATLIQTKSIPEILKGNDLFGIAQTGTGKTASFILPILQLMYNSNDNKENHSIQTLIITPTRELAAQIGDSIKKYGSSTKLKYTVIYGGVSQQIQKKALSKKVDILVATPGRLLDLLNQKALNLKNLKYFVLDEADRMLDMGFIDDIKKITKQMPNKKQTLFFSATMSKTIENLANDFLKNPIKIEIKPKKVTLENIKQRLFYVDSKDKDELLLKIIKKEKIKTALVFTRTKYKSDKIAAFLNKNKISAKSINGDKSQFQRTKALKDFKFKKIRVLVATEVMARGIDINNISHVINYEIPDEAESYIHRIGRTARAGNNGTAYSFCSAEEKNYILSIEKLIKDKLQIKEHEKHSPKAQNARGKNVKFNPKRRKKTTFKKKKRYYN